MKEIKTAVIWIVWAAIAIWLMAWKPGNLGFVAICLVLGVVGYFLTSKIWEG